MANERRWLVEDLENQTLVAITIARNALQKAELRSLEMGCGNIGIITAAILDELLSNGSEMLEEKMIGALMIAKKAIYRDEENRFNSAGGISLSFSNDIGRIASVIFKKLVSR